MTRIDGTDGNDDLFGTEGNDTIYGLGGDDTLDGGIGGNDLLDGGDGDDELFAGSGVNTLLGGAGDDDLSTFSGGLLDGGTGDDTVQGALFEGAAPVTLDGGEGQDVWRIEGGLPRALFGTAQGWDFSDFEPGATYTFGRSVVRGFEGVSVFDTDSNGRVIRMVGSGGNDRFETQNGSDTLIGGAGDDTLIVRFGEPEGGNVLISGGAGDDRLRMSGGGASDTLDGGDGIDLLLYDGLWRERSSTSFPERYVDANTFGGPDDGYGPGDAQVLNTEGYAFGRGADFAQTLIGSALIEEASGGGGNDTLEGRGGNDTLGGDEGADALSGGAGDDLLIGGDGADALTGGAGDDVLYGDGLG